MSLNFKFNKPKLEDEAIYGSVLAFKSYVEWVNSGTGLVVAVEDADHDDLGGVFKTLGNEYEEGHVQGAVNIPVGDIEEGHIGELTDAGKDTPLQLYCRSGARSAYACALLQSAGFTSAPSVGVMSRPVG